MMYESIGMTNVGVLSERNDKLYVIRTIKVIVCTKILYAIVFLSFINDNQ